AWEMVRSLRSLGKTILLTTHYLDEAEQLCDRVAVLRAGEIVRLGTPGALAAGADAACPPHVRAGRRALPRTPEPTRAPHALPSQALADGHELEALEVRRPSLEDVY